ncbi:MAG: pyridoxamine 5'-phosphate oxidase family protein [Bacteroidota bacterium]|nr:pyridoxamine 5'-phosphate oxidase family protein [Bacteroidota bacterium]
MIGNLTEIQIDELLHKEVVGRIGCYANDVVYVVPISYVYDGKNIYAHTYEGLKTEIMRKNPNVCFQVDDYNDMGNWQSAIAWGKFEEIDEGEERISALKLLLNRPLPVVSSITTHLGKSWPFYSDDLEKIDGIVFRIVLTKHTGKFESTTTSPAVTG